MKPRSARYTADAPESTRCRYGVTCARVHNGKVVMAIESNTAAGYKTGHAVIDRYSVTFASKLYTAKEEAQEQADLMEAVDAL